MKEVPTIYWNSLAAILRHVLTAVSGLMISKGWMTASQTSAQGIESLAGTIVLLASIGFSIWNQYKSKQILNVALASNVSTEVEAVQKVKKGENIPSVFTPPNQIPTNGNGVHVNNK